MWPDDNTDLPVEVWAAFGADPAGDPADWRWTDLTDRLQDNPIPLRRGSSSGTGDVQPSSATIHLDNGDGALTPLYGASEYWPDVVLGTPIWLTLRRVSDGFTRTASNGWGTSESGQTWTASNGSASDYSVSSGSGRMAHTTLNVLRRMRLPDVSLLDTHQVVDVSTSALLTGAALVTGVLARYVDSSNYYWLRTEFNSGGTSIMLKIVRVSGGSSTELAVLNPVPGLAYAADTPLRTRTSVVGDRLSMRVWPASDPEPTGWHVDVTDPDPLTDPGAAGLQSWLVAGNTNPSTVTASFDNYAVRVDLLNGFADQWQPQFLPSTDGMHSIVRLTASGILRRLGQGNSVVRSALTRYLPGTEPIVWWPLEDGVDATQAASGLLDGLPMTVAAGIMDFVDDAPPGAAGSAHPRPDAANALIGTITGASSTGFQISVWTKGEVSDRGSYAHYIPWEVRTSTGQIFRLVMQSAVSSAIGVNQYTSESDEDAANFIALPGPDGITGNWIHCQFLIEQNGANADAYLYVDGSLVDSATWVGVTIGSPTRVNATGRFAGPTAEVGLNMRDIWISQLAVHDYTSGLLVQYPQGMGNPGELASDRIERVCTERGIPIYVHPGDSEPLGPQPAAGDLDVLRDAEQADMGILYERGWGLAYRPRSTRYNQTPALVVDLDPPYMHSESTRPESVVAPTYDDQGTRNDVTVSRRDGSSARVIDSAHAVRHGVYDESVAIGVATDDVLLSHAGWRVHLGTWEEMRYPGITVDLAGNPSLVDDWLNLGVGDRIQQTNVPTPHPPEDVDQLAAGISQTLSRRGTWSGTVVGYPARPWDVATADGPQRVPARGSTVAHAIGAADTALLLASTIDNGPWVVGDSGDWPNVFPLAVMVGGGGEEIAVSEIGPSVVDGMTRTVGNGWGTPDLSYRGVPWAVEGTASNYSVVGGSTARMATPSTNTLYVAHLDIGAADGEIEARVTVPVLPAGAPITVRISGRYTDTANLIEAQVTLATSGAATLQLFRRVNGTGSAVPGTGSVPVGSHAAGNAWVLRLAYDGDRLYARAWNASTGTDPGHWQAYGQDDTVPRGTQIACLARRETSNSNGTQNIDWDNVRAIVPQTMTISARGVNGVQRAWPVGTEVQVRDRAIAAL